MPGSRHTEDEKDICREQREIGFLIEFQRRQGTLSGIILVNISGQSSLDVLYLRGQNP